MLAIQKLFPNIEHRFCLRHIYSSFILPFTSLELRDALWRCACASIEREFGRNMEYLKGLDENAWGYLKAIP